MLFFVRLSVSFLSVHKVNIMKLTCRKIKFHHILFTLIFHELLSAISKLSNADPSQHSTVVDSGRQPVNTRCCNPCDRPSKLSISLLILPKYLDIWRCIWIHRLQDLPEVRWEGKTFGQSVLCGLHRALNWNIFFTFFDRWCVRDCPDNPLYVCLEKKSRSF